MNRLKASRARDVSMSKECVWTSSWSQVVVEGEVVEKTEPGVNSAELTVIGRSDDPTWPSVQMLHVNDEV